MYEDLILTTSSKYGVPQTWIQAIIEIESSWNPKAYRAEPSINDASYGLGQFLYKTAQSLGYTGTKEGLYDPATNIDLIGKYIQKIRLKTYDDFQATISEYNSGSSIAWLTNTQVAAHVAKAVAALQKWTAIAIGAVTGSVGSSATVMLIMAVLLMMWVKKR